MATKVAPGWRHTATGHAGEGRMPNLYDTALSLQDGDCKEGADTKRAWPAWRGVPLAAAPFIYQESYEMIQSMSMNRKQRRLQEKKTGKKTSLKSRNDAAKASELKEQGMALKNAGNDEEAIPLLKEALKLDNGLADVHFTLAMLCRTKKDLALDMDQINALVKNKQVLKRSYIDILNILRTRKQYDEAMVGQEELCRLFPDDDEQQVNFALLLSMAERKTAASSVLAKLMVKHPDNKRYKAMFVSICSFTGFMYFDPHVKSAVQACFDNIYESNLLKLYKTWLTTARQDPDCKGLKETETLVTDDEFLEWAENVTIDDAPFLHDKFFLDGIRLLIIADPVMEIFLTRLRKWICLNAERLAKEGKLSLFEPFLTVLAEQCFFNEYVFAETDEEKQAVQKLIDNVKNTANITKPQAYALIGCYQTLYALFPDDSAIFKELAGESSAFANLAKTQFFDQLEENNIKKELSAFGAMENQVSKDVQNQYEENPYPRWISVMGFPALADHIAYNEKDRLKAKSVLIAGCGTGRQAIDTAANYTEAKITAIDLSRASLAYAQRKAREASLAHRIDFIHADILSMEQWDGQFDVVECSGVMHHMEDPFKGWGVLTDKLKPGGFFKVGLYSETARKAYVEGQDMAKENNLPPTLDGIRTFRKMLLDMPTNSETRKLISGSGDFYTTSLVRDLIFHVQEHRMTLPQIKEMMDKLNLECTSFVVPDVISIKRYDRKFPDNPDRNDLLNWHEIEEKHPLTFIAMYQFWCRKLR